MNSQNTKNIDNSVSIILSTYNEASVIEDTLTKIFETQTTCLKVESINFTNEILIKFKTKHHGAHHKGQFN